MSHLHEVCGLKHVGVWVERKKERKEKESAASLQSKQLVLFGG